MMNGSPHLKNSMCAATLPSDELPAPPAVDPEQVSTELTSGTEYYYERLLLTEDQLRLLMQQTTLTPKTMRTIENHRTWGIDENGRYRIYYAFLDDVKDDKMLGYRRERVFWKLSVGQSRILQHLNATRLAGQSSELFRWTAEAEASATMQHQALDVPYLSAVLGLQSKKRKASTGGGEDTAAGSGAAGATPKPVMVNKRSVANDSTYKSWEPERKVGRWNLEAKPDAASSRPVVPTQTSPVKSLPRVPPFGEQPRLALTAEALALLHAGSATPPSSARSASQASPPPVESPAFDAASNMAESEDGDAKSLYKECPKEVPDKAEYWIMKNDLFAHINNGKLKNCIKEARNLLENMRGKAEYAGPYSNLTKHMQNVEKVSKIKKERIVAGDVTDGDIEKNIAPILALKGGADRLDPSYMYALVCRKCNLLVPPGASVDDTSNQVVNELWQRIRPWSGTIDLMADSLAEFDALQQDSCPDTLPHSTQDPETPDGGTQSAGGPSNMLTESFDPLNPKLAAVSTRNNQERSKMTTAVVIDNLICSAILKDEGYRGSTHSLAKHFTDAIQHDLAASVVPSHYTAYAFDLLTTLRQISFLVDVGLGSAHADYSERYAEFNEFLQAKTATTGQQISVQKSVLSSLETSEWWNNQISFATTTHEATKKIFDHLDPIDIAMGKYLANKPEDLETIAFHPPWEEMTRLVENFHTWRATSNKAVGSAFEDSLAKFVRCTAYLKMAIGKLHENGKLTQSIDPIIHVLTVAVKQFPEESTLHVVLENLKSLKMEKSTIHFSTRLETDCKEVQAAVKNLDYDKVLVKKLQTTTIELQGIKLTTEAKKRLYKTVLSTAAWAFDTWTNIQKEPLLDKESVTDLILKSCELLKIGTDDPTAPAYELRALGLLFRDLKSCKETETFLLEQGLMGGAEKEQQLVANDKHAGYHSISKFASLYRQCAATLDAFKGNSNFAEVKDHFEKFQSDQLRYWDAQIDLLVGLVMATEAAELVGLQTSLQKTAAGGTDGEPWHQKVPPEVLDFDGLLEMDVLVDYPAKQQRQLKTELETALHP